MNPIIKWVGGKSWAIDYVKKLVTSDMLETGTYIEPFGGGAAIALALTPKKVLLGDSNLELINLYLVASHHPEELIEKLRVMQDCHSKDFFYEVRALDRSPDFKSTTPVDRAARFMYLNRTCFNGLYRVNSKGFFNTPIGRSSSGKPIDIVQADKIREFAKYCSDSRNSVNFLCADYLEVTAKVQRGDIVVLDPPYTQTNHTSYQKEGFTWEDTEKLKVECDRLRGLGCNLIIFNEGTPEIKELFKDYEIQEISIKRTISCKGDNRKANEVLITNII